LTNAEIIDIKVNNMTSVSKQSVHGEPVEAVLSLSGSSRIIGIAIIIAIIIIGAAP
jgi:hypothetical protein